MKPEITRGLNLPYNQYDAYWICIVHRVPGQSANLQKMLADVGFKPVSGQESMWVIQCDRAWDKSWRTIYSLIESNNHLALVDVAVIPAVGTLRADDVNMNRKPPEVIHSIASSLWLGEAMIDDRVRCHMQSIIDKRGKVFGHEAFARVIGADNKTISGGAIFSASRPLNVEYQLDRILHVQAIKTFIQSDLEGFLFVNFVPGFIHRPEKYLEGLTEAARMYNMQAKNIVLEFTKAETPRDALHLRGIFDYCRSKGYSVSLDDINSASAAARIVDVIKPDFLRIDMGLVREVQKPAELKTVRELVQLCHASGCQVIAEGVETEPVHKALKEADVDLFQGYLFSQPQAAPSRKEVG